LQKWRERVEERRDFMAREKEKIREKMVIEEGKERE